MQINISNIKSPDILIALQDVFNETGITSGDAGRKLYLEKQEKGLSIEIKEDKVIIKYARRCEIFRAIGLLKENYDSNEFNLTEIPRYKTLALLVDNSRNAVNNIDTIKKAIRILALMGYNMYMLYLEDTYEIPEYKYFGHMRGRYTKAEIKELDEYAKKFGIELVPAIQTLAHLNCIFKWPDFQTIRDIDDIVLVGSEDTYKLINAMIKSISEMFSTKRINIGMDEAFSLGRGKYFDINGKQSKKEIMIRHLNRVLDICKNYGMQPMMWSDMFTRSEEGCIEFLPDEISNNVALIHWDYVTTNTEHLENALRIHKKLAKKVLFAGGAWKWEGYSPYLRFSYIASQKALEAINNCGIDEIIVTSWADGGGEASLFCVLPVYQMYAEACYRGDVSEEHIGKRLYACADAKISDFNLLELPNLPVDGEIGGNYEMNPIRYLPFQDILLGLYDKHIVENKFSEHYKKLIPMYENAISENPKWAYIFEFMLELVKFLQYKCDIGIKLKKAYDEHNIEELNKLLLQLYVLKDCCENFHNKLRRQWLIENKGHGLEIQDIRIGGVKSRIETAIIRISDYLDNKISKIDELEDERLYVDGRASDSTNSPNTHVWFWKDVVTPGVLER